MNIYLYIYVRILEALLLAIKMWTGFTTDVLWRNTLHSFVFLHRTSVVKPMHIFMAKSRVSKLCLMAELCFYHFLYFGCVTICIFRIHHKQCASD